MGSCRGNGLVEVVRRTKQERLGLKSVLDLSQCSSKELIYGT